MRANPTDPGVFARETREINAIVLLHTHKDTIFEALENSENPLAAFTLGELREFLQV